MNEMLKGGADKERIEFLAFWISFPIFPLWAIHQLADVAAKLLAGFIIPCIEHPGGPSDRSDGTGTRIAR